MHIHTHIHARAEIHINSKSPGMQTQNTVSPLDPTLPVKAGASSSVASRSLNMTFVSALVLMLAVWLWLGLCSGLERECLMTGEGSVAGQTNYGGEEVEGIHTHCWHSSKTKALF